MPVLNSDIASDLDKVADLLELESANPFRVRAYRNAARTVGELPRNVATMLAEGEDLSELPGIGKDLAEKIAVLATTGHLPILEEMERRAPAGIVKLLEVPGLGPKRVRALSDRLGINSLAALAAAAKAGKIRALAGFGAKSEARLLDEAERRSAAAKRILRPVAEEVAEPLLRHLAGAPGVSRAAIAGSYRRRRETVGDLDLVAAAPRGGPVIEHFVGYEDTERILARGATRSSMVLRNGVQVDLRVVTPASYGAALLYFTGSKAHNIALRQIAADRGLKLNEYGLFKGARRVAAGTEAELYARLDLPYIEPELREDHGEIEAAQRGTLPRLVAVDDIRGDLHAHTVASDGRDSLPDMVRAARERGYAYVAITEHSRRVTVARGLDARRLARQIDEIDRLNESGPGLVVLKSVEVDILEDGRLDLPDSILARLDFAVAAVHSAFDLSRETQTDRLLRAMDNRHVAVLAHPTGRLIESRPGYDLDIERLLRGALDRGCALEVNGQPQRLDVNEWHCKLAKEIGVKLVLSTDAHSTAELGFMRLAVDQARRGWLEPKDVLNTRDVAGLRRALRR